jgi:hypothetical protein
MSKLPAFHAIAATRGDGLRPELLHAMTRSPASTTLSLCPEVGDEPKVASGASTRLRQLHAAMAERTKGARRAGGTGG